MSIVKLPGPASLTTTTASNIDPDRTTLCFSRSAMRSPPGSGADDGKLPHRGLRPGVPVYVVSPTEMATFLPY